MQKATRYRQGPSQTHIGLEVDLPRSRVADVLFQNGKPDQELLALYACYLPHLVMLGECGDLGVVGDHVKAVLGLLLLQDPDESGLAIVTELNDVIEALDAYWEAQPCLKV